MQIIEYLEANGWEYISGTRNGGYSYMTDNYQTKFKKGEFDLRIGLFGERHTELTISNKDGFLFRTTDYSPDSMTDILDALESGSLVKVEYIEKYSGIDGKCIEVCTDTKYLLEHELFPVHKLTQ